MRGAHGDKKEYFVEKKYEISLLLAEYKSFTTGHLMLFDHILTGADLIKNYSSSRRCWYILKLLETIMT